MKKSRLDPTMSMHRFTKEDQHWYIDIPPHLQQRCAQAKLKITEGVHVFLEKIANGDRAMTLLMDTRSFREAAVLELQELGDAPQGGGWYRMLNCNGRVIKKKMWLCDIPLFVFGDLPEKIYLKKVPS